ncbi:hypothetical protein GUJ93_ZPchr0012g20990 [Zizania palustris]|uniref:NB-ARC domain-containing protein n=1 Tax=Zizania palustris TaxID=103762 RepID=A0A8J5WMW5_ZIZPA|nr:hypothetical protein GUJ93_ZPchr0012g20990 [Zizania palustris]
MAVVLGAFVPDTAAQWRSVVKGEVARQMGVEAEAKKLEERLEKVGAAVRDAEARAARGDDAAAAWLDKVRAAAYEADVAVDRCRVLARRLRNREQQQQQNHHQSLPWLLSSCCDVGEPRRDIVAGMKNVSQKLKAILKEQRQLQLHASVADQTLHERKVLRHRKSDPTEIDIVGAAMEEDARRLLHRLMHKDDQAACGVVAVVGPDGIGKTTLAKVVYDSERVRRSFETRSWVTLSRGYSIDVEADQREAALLSEVIDAVGGDVMGAKTVSDLKAMLAGLVANKRFLLVLDDVRHGGEWEDVLRRPLANGGRGSKVLVTARHGSIARVMGAGYIHRVKRLGADDGWALLRVSACVADDGGGEATAALKGLGERIVVEKCAGVPLAIKAVAGVLRTREAIVEEWAEVLASPAWSVKGLPDDAMKPLYLCYDDMPCHLKQCFLYCSLFLSDFAADRRALVQQWIAQGFVQIRGDAGVEEVAEEYYDELVGRNLLQPAKADRRGCVERCTVHDMLRSMAQVLSHGENFTCDTPRPPDDGGDASSFAPRYVSFPRSYLAAIPERLVKLEGTRTLLLQRNPLTIEGNMFARLHHLKVLDLTETAMEVIPETLGSLFYLRFLNLSQTRIKSLPETIGNLWSLKFLLLRECKSLHVLPKGIENLKGLRDLDIAGTVINDAAFRVGQLRSLTSLRCFAVTSKEERAADDKSGWPLDELHNLSQLRTLHVKKLEKATSLSEAAGVTLAGKTGLRELELSCSSTLKSFEIPTAVRKIEDILIIFQELHPPRCLESLKIANYFGTKFPSWLSPTCLPNLCRLNITGCNLCESFPPLGRLPELRSLCIADSSALKDIDAQFTDTDHCHQVPFPKLEDLHLQELHNLKTWSSIEAGALPSLQALQLESCPKLRCLPAGLRHVTSMTELRIVDMESLEAVDNIPSLRELSVWNTPNLKKICDLPSLKDLNICHCPVLETVQGINSLQEVHIFDLELQQMPRWIEAYASKLCALEFKSTTKLLKRCLVDGPDWSVIKGIALVHGYSTDSSYIYYSKSPYIFDSTVSVQESLDMEGHPADSHKTDDASTGGKNIDQQDDLVSTSGTSDLETNDFFDSKLVSARTTRSEDSGSDKNKEKYLNRPTGRRMHKLAEVPEDCEDEEGADYVVVFPANTTKATVPEKLRPAVTHDHNDKDIAHKPQTITNDGSGHDTNDNLILTKQRGSKMKKDAPTDVKTDLGTSVIKPTAKIVHKLVREGSQAINITETDQDLNLSSFESKRHASNKDKVDASDSDTGKDTTNIPSSCTFARRSVEMALKTSGTEADNEQVTVQARNTSCASEVNLSSSSARAKVKEGRHRSVSVKKSIPKTVKFAPMEETKSNCKETDNSLPCSRQTTSKKENDVSIDADTMMAAIHPSNTFTESHPDKVNKTAASATEVMKISNEVIYCNFIATQDLHPISCHNEKRLPDVVNNICTSANDNHDQMGCNNKSLSDNLNHEESRSISATETTCDSGPCKSTATSACKHQTLKRQGTTVTDPSDDTDASIRKIIGLASKISEKVSSTCSPVSLKHQSAETLKKISRSPSKPMDSGPHAIDIAEAAMNPEVSKATLTNRFPANAAAKDGLTDDKTPVSISIKADDSHQPPKVYTAIWADTDTDTLKARFLSSMQHYRRMASRRRRRHRKHGSESKWKWNIVSVLVAVLLLVSVAQLLFTLWLYRRLLK